MSSYAIYRLPGLDFSPGTDRFILGRHSTTAQGICSAYHAEYLSAKTDDELEAVIADSVRHEHRRSVVPEIFL